MSLATLLTQTAVVVHVAYDAIDEYGNITAGTTQSETVLARLEALSSDELVRDRDTIVADWRIFLPATVTVGPFDQIQADGKTFDVWGDPIVQRTPRGAHHQEIRLRRVT